MEKSERALGLSEIGPIHKNECKTRALIRFNLITDPYGKFPGSHFTGNQLLEHLNLATRHAYPGDSDS